MHKRAQPVNIRRQRRAQAVIQGPASCPWPSQALLGKNRRSYYTFLLVGLDGRRPAMAARTGNDARALRTFRAGGKRFPQNRKPGRFAKTGWWRTQSCETSLHTLTCYRPKNRDKL